MTTELLLNTPQSSDYQSLPPTTRVWIYQAAQAFSETDIPQLKKELSQFAERWASHSRQLRAYGDVLFDRFIILMVDESQVGASGCSIDSSVNYLRQLGEAYKLDLFDRMTFAWLENGEVKTAKSDEFPALFSEGKITYETLVFDNLVNNKADFEEKWLKPLGQSWHKRFV